jgi:outer membrane protein assembly factor BamB
MQHSPEPLLLSFTLVFCVTVGGILLGGCRKNLSTDKLNLSEDPPEVTVVVDAPKPTSGPFRLLFEKEYPKHSFSVTPILLEDRLIMADYEGHVTSLQMPGGEIIWEFQGDSLGYEATPVHDAGRLFVAAYEGFVDCLDLATGDPIWNFNGDAPITADPLVHGNVVLIGTHNGLLFCLDKATGKELWQFQASDQIHSAPQVAGDKVLLIASCSSTVHILGLDDGLETEQIHLPSETVAPFSVDGDQLYVTTMLGEAVCYDWKKTEQIWIYPFNEELQPQIQGGPLIMDGVMYVGGTDNFLRALDTVTRKEIWKQRVKGSIDAPLVDAGAMIIAVSPRGRVYAADKKSGKIRWQFEASGDLLDSPLVVDDKVIIGTRAGILYQFGPISALP